MKFEEYPIRVPHEKTVNKKLSQYLDEFKKATNAKEASNIMKKFNHYLDNIESDGTVIQIHFSIETTNEKYRKAYEKLNETMPLISNAINEFNKALATSKFRPELEVKFGHHLFEMIDCSLKTFDEKIVPLLIEENNLGMEYDSITGGAKIPFRGEIYNLSQMSKFTTDLDRKTRKEASAAVSKWGDDHAKDLEEIYSKLVLNRDKQAKTLGFNDYTELGYLKLGRVDYNSKDVKNYRDQLFEEVVPLSNKLAKSQKSRLGIRKMQYYDWNLNYIDGNPRPLGDEEFLIKQAQKMYDEMSPETSEFFHFMQENHLLDLSARAGKQPGGYMTFMPKYKAPFIFSNFNGTEGDVNVLTHEGGHAFQGYLTRNMRIGDYRNPGLEACEIHSMSMEFFAWPWIELFFGDKANKYRYAHLEDAVRFLPYGATVDEFQHWVYAHPTATNEERDEQWKLIDQKYRPYMDFNESIFYSKGRRWLLQSHIFTAPFYYIDYTLAQVASFQFLAESRKDFKKAWSKYVRYAKLGGRYPFVSLLKHARIRVPFVDGNVKKAINPVKKILKSFDTTTL